MAPMIGDGLSDPRTHREDMIDYIKLHFADVLGDDLSLLETPGGLDALAAKIRARVLDLRCGR